MHDGRLFGDSGKICRAESYITMDRNNFCFSGLPL
jgi:hypothetical protein